MPIKDYKPFSKEEKEYILRRHKELVDQFNERLPQGKKLSYDNGLEKRLDNPDTVALYRIGQKVKRMQDDQKAILSEMERKFGKVTTTNCMSRSLFYAFDTSKTDDAKAYNEKLYKAYRENPEKVAYSRYNKLLEVDPREIFNCRDDKTKLAEYYLEHYPQCEEAFVFDSVLGKANPTPEMKSAIASMKKPMEVIAYPQSYMKVAHDLDYFAFPEMNAKQSEIIQLKGGEFMLNISETIRCRLNNALEDEVMDKPWKYFGKLQIRGIPLEKGTFLKNKPVEKSIVDGKTVYKEVSYDKLLGPADPNVELKKRNEKEIFGVKCMTRSFQAEYLKKWRENFQKRAGFAGNFDINAIEEYHKGGWFERNLLFSTSKQYKEMIKAMKDYNDPNSKFYCDKAHLRGKADAYVQRKHNQGYADVSQMKGTSKIRTELALNIITECDAHDDFEQVEKDWFKSNEPEPIVAPKQPFLRARDVAEDEHANENNNDMEVSKDLVEEDDLDMTM